jgi:hypothetical protein
MGGQGAESNDRKKAWSSINNSILSGVKGEDTSVSLSCPSSCFVPLWGGGKQHFITINYNASRPDSKYYY